MLRLINVCKSFKYGKNKLSILNNINLDFKKKEMVFILGKSGSGKSTLLNIIGGLLTIDSGKILLDDIEISKLKGNRLCYYRNNIVGFVFQDYHLVEYMTVLDNIKLGQTIKSNNIDNILIKLGIFDKKKVKVNKLSGGEKQRVAIARAIVNDPDIILCDEPTGALDSTNGINIMKILKEISKDKLVIVVSHDNNLANKFADRVINIVDGNVDYYPQIDKEQFNSIKKKKISLLSTIKLAIKNLCLRKLRTIFTSFAISLGFICALIILCLYRSFSDDINRLEKEAVSLFPISIYNGTFELNNSETVKSKDKIINKRKEDYIHENVISREYIEYINQIENINYITYDYDISMPILSDSYKYLDNIYMKQIPGDTFINTNYEVLYGKTSDSIYDILLKVDSNNNVDSELLKVFGIDGDVEYDELIGRKLKIIVNDLYYTKNVDYYIPDNNVDGLYQKSDIELKIVGIVREKEIVDDHSYFYYNNDLINYIIGINRNSKIVTDLLNSNYNVLGLDISKDMTLSYLGYNSLPFGINIYVDNLTSKEFVLSELDKYNEKNNKLIYVDNMKDVINLLKSVINIVSVILISFSLISIFVSSLMVFILTGTRVLERSKEIIILRSLGARTTDITRLFNIENAIIALISSFMGIVITYFLTQPINTIMGTFLDGGIFKLHIKYTIVLSILNQLIVLIAGYIPAKRTSSRIVSDNLYRKN